jgi:hypothetical protein
MALLQIWFGTELIAQDRVGAHAKPVEITLTLSKRQPGFECRLTVIHDAWEDWSWGEALAVELRDLRVTELRQADPNVLTISSATAQIDWLAASRLSQDRQ